MRSFYCVSGWEINASKSFGLSWLRDGRGRILEEGELELWGDRRIKLMRRDEKFRYLGVQIGPTIKINLNSKNYEQIIEKQLQTVANSELSIANKIHAIKSLITPRHLYRLSNFCHRGMWATKSRVNLTRCFEKCDMKIRKTVKQVTRVPEFGVSIDILYLPMSKGGLGLKKLQNLIPAQRLSNFNKIATTEAMKSFLSEWAYRDVEMMSEILIRQGFNIQQPIPQQVTAVTVKQIRTKALSAKLYIPQGSVKHIPLIRDIKGKGVGLSGTDLQRGVKLRTDSFRTNNYLKIRKKVQSDLCRRCAKARETVEHLVNNRDCVEHNGGRFWTERHNAITAKLYDWFRTFSGAEIAKEPELRAQNRYRPDFLVRKDKAVFVNEVGVCWESARRLDATHSRLIEVRSLKTRKYSTADFHTAVMNWYRSRNIDVDSITVVPLIFGARGAYFSECDKWVKFCRVVGFKKAKENILRFCARTALQMTAKYVSTVLRDHGLYGTTEVVQSSFNPS